MKKITSALAGAVLIFATSCEKNMHGELILENADTTRGFNHAYYLFIPEQMRKSENLTLLVEPNNTGFASDDLDDHVEGAKQMIENFGYLGKYLADSLGYPLLVPAFPRSETSWQVYTHALDRDAILTTDPTIKRIDLQLIAMIEHAKATLATRGYRLQPKVIMTGFSASATFTNRFTLIHPDKVSVCAAGGLNGILMLPLYALDSTALNYPLGLGDFRTIFRDSIDMRSLSVLPQFFFMGEKDDNDALDYDDAYDSIERNIVHRQIGKRMQPDRWNFCASVYSERLPNVTIRTYDGIGHTITDEIRNDVLQFIKKQLAANRL